MSLYRRAFQCPDIDSSLWRWRELTNSFPTYCTVLEFYAPSISEILQPVGRPNSTFGIPFEGNDKVSIMLNEDRSQTYLQNLLKT
jgi:hypothetical protein